MERVTNHVARTEGHKGLYVLTGVQDHTITGNDHQEPIHCLSREREREREMRSGPEQETSGEDEYPPGLSDLLEHSPCGFHSHHMLWGE